MKKLEIDPAQKDVAWQGTRFDPLMQVDIWPSDSEGYYHISHKDIFSGEWFTKRPILHSAIRYWFSANDLEPASFDWDKIDPPPVILSGKQEQKEEHTSADSPIELPDDGDNAEIAEPEPDGTPSREPIKLYFIKAIGHAIVKIGIARDVERRRRQLQAGSPLLLETCAMFEGSVRDERAMHARFSRHRLHGEWFKFDPEIYTYLRERGAI